MNEKKKWKETKTNEKEREGKTQVLEKRRSLQKEIIFFLPFFVLNENRQNKIKNERRENEENWKLHEEKKLFVFFMLNIW